VQSYGYLAHSGPIGKHSGPASVDILGCGARCRSYWSSSKKLPSTRSSRPP